MAKKGQKQPFKIEFQYPGQKRWKHALPSRAEAELRARDIAARGAEVEFYYLDPETGARVDLEVPEPDSDIEY